MIMIENQSISKKERMDFKAGRDMLSELPLNIIHIILARVPFRDAVRTSILSRQWRYTWATLPHLVFDEYDPFRDYNSIVKFDDYMENFITHILFLHKGPIHKFTLSVPSEGSFRSIGAWLLCLSRNDIRELIIGNYYGHSGTQELHSSIYSCKKLTKLELINCELDPPPTTFKSFLFLRCLFLQKVHLSTDEVESLVANCPLLEEFTLINSGNTQLRISAPNLKVLDIADDYVEMSVYAPLLADLSVELQYCGFGANHGQQNSSVCNYTDFLGGFTNLEKLYGDYHFTKYLSTGIESCHQTLVFDRLEDIELVEVNFGDIKEISVVARLIVGAPNLQRLRIEHDCADIDETNGEVPHVSFSDFGCASNIKLEKLRVVEMDGLSGLPLEMEFIKFLLERSPVLEAVNFRGLSCEEEQNVSTELEGCSKASPNSKLVMTSY